MTPEDDDRGCRVSVMLPFPYHRRPAGTSEQDLSDLTEHHRSVALAALTGSALSSNPGWLAQQHPDATAEHIIAACDANTLEQQPAARAGGAPQPVADERSAQAIDYAATDALIAQLRITYPGIPRDAIAGIVDELRITLADSGLRGLSLWRLEHEAHQRLA